MEELDRPELKDVPFSVGKGVLTTCNYHARKFGCRSGMAGFVARKLCPQLIQLPLNFDKYTAKAQEVREIIVDYDPRFESASIDEAYLNITEYCHRNDIDPEEAVEQLRREVHEKTKITISAGIAANAKLAKYVVSPSRGVVLVELWIRNSLVIWSILCSIYSCYFDELMLIQMLSQNMFQQKQA